MAIMPLGIGDFYHHPFVIGDKKSFLNSLEATSRKLPKQSIRPISWLFYLEKIKNVSSFQIDFHVRINNITKSGEIILETQLGVKRFYYLKGKGFRAFFPIKVDLHYFEMALKPLDY